MSSRRRLTTLLSRIGRRRATRNVLHLTQHVLLPPAQGPRPGTWVPQTYTFASRPDATRTARKQAARAWATRGYDHGLIRGIPPGKPGSQFTNSNGDAFGPGFLNEDGEVFIWKWKSGSSTNAQPVKYHVSIYYGERPERNNGFGFHVTTESGPKTHFYFDRHGNFLCTTRKGKEIRLSPPAKVSTIADAMEEMLIKYRLRDVPASQVHRNLFVPSR